MKFGSQQIDDDQKKRLAIRLKNNVDFIDGANGCWIWTGSKSVSGYGRLRVGNKQYITSQISYVVFKEDLKVGEVVRHKCDTRLCINPEHLEAGTHQDNMNDTNRNLGPTILKAQRHQKTSTR